MPAGCCSIRGMKKTLTIASTLIIGLALTLGACGKDKKPAATESTTAEPAKADPKAEPTEPAAADPKPAPAPAAAGGGGW